jgi:WW domain-containing oxidoreductase
VYVAAHPDVKGFSGEYFADCNVAERSAFAKDAALGERLWQVSEALTAKYELLNHE